MSNLTEIRICPVCGGGLHMISLTNKVNYYCESGYCSLLPFSRYSIIYDNNKVLSASTILDIDDVHYRLVNYYNFPSCTVIGTIDTFLQQTNGPEFDRYTFNRLSKIDNIIPWDNTLSAYNVITRILKIKAFA